MTCFQEYAHNIQEQDLDTLLMKLVEEKETRNQKRREVNNGRS